MKSYIFYQQRSELFSDVDMVGFTIIDSLPKAFRHGGILYKHFGFLDYLKLLLKSSMKNRVFFYLNRYERIVTCGTLAIGFCNHYEVSSGDVVIGSIWTAKHCRGQGFATLGIRAAMNHMVFSGFSTFYIDTHEKNTAMLKAVEKIEFGKPTGDFVYQE